MSEQTLPAIDFDADNLYREETISDRRVGTITRLLPINSDGSDDPQRAVVYMGQTQLLTPMGSLPISFEIEADSLEAAVAKFPEAAKAGVEDTLRELQEMRREAASQIVVPGPGDLGGLGGPGGKIQI